MLFATMELGLATALIAQQVAPKDWGLNASEPSLAAQTVDICGSSHGVCRRMRAASQEVLCVAQVFLTYQGVHPMCLWESLLVRLAQHFTKFRWNILYSCV